MEFQTYFDNSATSYPKPPCVLKAVADYMTNLGVSPGRGTYKKARNADRMLYETRKSLASLFGIAHPTQIIFCNNATEAINLALKGFLKSDQHVLTTAAEHNAVWRPLNVLAKERGIHIHTIPCNSEGLLDLDVAEQKLKQGIDLGIFVHGSNVIGSIFPIEQLTDLCHKYKTTVVVDASQTAGVVPIDVEKWGVDMLAFTGHKGLMGPTGTGGLYLRKGLHLKTLKEGGTGSMSSSPYQPEDAPDRYEAGTLNMAGLAGLKAGVDFIRSYGLENLFEKETCLIQKLIKEIEDIPGILLYGPPAGKERLGLLSINISGMDSYELSRRLDERYDIMTRAGLHCAPQAHRCIGTQDIGALRISLGAFHEEKDIEYLANALREIAQEGICS